MQLYLPDSTITKHLVEKKVMIAIIQHVEQVEMVLYWNVSAKNRAMKTI